MTKLYRAAHTFYPSPGHSVTYETGWCASSAEAWRSLFEALDLSEVYTPPRWWQWWRWHERRLAIPASEIAVDFTGMAEPPRARVAEHVEDYTEART